MRRLSGPVMLGAALLFVITGPIQGQDELLAGLGAVNAQIRLIWDDDLPGSESATKERLQTLFESELRRVGIAISEEAPAFLNLRLIVLEASSGARPIGAVFSYSLVVREMVAGGARTFQSATAYADTWRTAQGVRTGPLDGVNASLVEKVTELAQEFANAYLKANGVLQMNPRTEGARTYCEVVIELHEILDDPESDLDLGDVRTDEAEKDFASVWMEFDERLRRAAPNPEILSALELISRSERSVLDGRQRSAETLIDYAEAFAEVMNFHVENCLPPERE